MEKFECPECGHKVEAMVTTPDGHQTVMPKCVECEVKMEEVRDKEIGNPLGQTPYAEDRGEYNYAEVTSKPYIKVDVQVSL